MLAVTVTVALVLVLLLLLAGKKPTDSETERNKTREPFLPVRVVGSAGVARTARARAEEEKRREEKTEQIQTH